MRSIPVGLWLLVAALVFGACGDGGRDRVERYIEEANRIQQRADPAFQRANEAYVRFSQRELAPAVATRDLARAERAIRATRARIAALTPPAEARLLHRRLLRVFDANAAMAAETTQLARYLPRAQQAVAPLEAISARLRRRLADASAPAAQGRALRRYESELGRLIGRLRALEPPPVLQPTHEAQLARLQSARDLAKQLRRALAAQDGRRVARLLLRFRKVDQAGRRAESVTARAIRAYGRRYRELTAVAQAAQRERTRLERALE